MPKFGNEPQKMRGGTTDKQGRTDNPHHSFSNPLPGSRILRDGKVEHKGALYYDMTDALHAHRMQTDDKYRKNWYENEQRRNKSYGTAHPHENRNK